MQTYKLNDQEFVFELNGAKYCALMNVSMDRNEVLEVDVHSLIDYETEQLLTRLEPNFLAWAKAEQLANLKAMIMHSDYWGLE